MEYLDYSQQANWEPHSSFESPIDLTVSQNLHQSFTQQPLSLTFTANELLVNKEQANGDQFLAQGSLNIGGQKFELQRLHFHDGSEHTINGQHFDGEIHLVYQNAAQANLVLAILCEVAPDFQEQLPLSQIYQEQASSSDLAELLPDELSYYTYTGSLTTPPLQTGVTWVVLAQPHLISKESKAALHSNYPDNHRELQAVNDRKVQFFQQ